jgi:hypothetical protein
VCVCLHEDGISTEVAFHWNVRNCLLAIKSENEKMGKESGEKNKISGGDVGFEVFTQVITKTCMLCVVR